MLPTAWSSPNAATPTDWEINLAVLSATGFDADVNFDDMNTFFDGIDPLLINN